MARESSRVANKAWLTLVPAWEKLRHARAQARVLQTWTGDCCTPSCQVCNLQIEAMCVCEQASVCVPTAATEFDPIHATNAVVIGSVSAHIFYTCSGKGVPDCLRLNFERRRALDRTRCCAWCQWRHKRVRLPGHRGGFNKRSHLLSATVMVMRQGMILAGTSSTAMWHPLTPSRPHS